MKKYIPLLFCSFLVTQLKAQQPLIPQKDTVVTNVTVAKPTFHEQRAKAEKMASSLNIKLREVGKHTGIISEFAGFAPNGHMLFYTTDNIGAARSLSTHKVWPGGTSGTSLTGSGMGNRLGEWDGGAVLASHQEFGGRVVQVDGATDLSDHATHVAGTMVASGVVANAKGMAYQANLRAYDWNNDESEMANAAAGGMLVSNHSYGLISGWRYNENQQIWEWWGDISISTAEDYKFGFYDDQAQSWDQIAVNNPFYLICKSAGNDRGDNAQGNAWYTRDQFGQWQLGSGTKPGADGQYDCISSAGVAKNVLTIGAVNKIGNSNTNDGWNGINSVVMSSFSGWGPTDDGRVKPDIVAAGVDLYSAFTPGNTDYATLSGTSMASPSASGSILLVQQHHFNLKARYMRAATTKGLVIHTADDAGRIGPDYIYGWGLMNTSQAVSLISDSARNMILERTLTNSSTYTQNISSDGATPLKITISWTDPAGNPTAPQLDPTDLMLRNDLDVRLRRNSDNVVFSPYILNPATPTANATTGDNIRDNVEQIFLATPTAGSYTILVTHKGTLSPSSQAFSLIISGIEAKPSVVVLANANSICTSNSVTFTDNSSGNPTSRMWYFPGGTPSTSTAAQVTVSYPSQGRFPVALRVTNALGSDSTYLPNYIEVGGSRLPFLETFEANASSTLSGWGVDNTNNDTTWRLGSVGGTLPGSTAAMIALYDYSTVGRRDGLISPPLNLTGWLNVSLTFKHAYCNYTNNPVQDSLIVFVSNNCGASWVRLAAYGESQLATVPQSGNNFVPTTASQWCISNCKTIDLSAYSNLPNIRVKFESYNGYGNNLFIDNVSLTGTAIKPLVQFGTNPTTVCAGSFFTLTDSSLNAPTAWTWTIQGADTLTSNAQHFTTSLSKPGTYLIKLRATNSGGSDSLIKPSYLTVLPAPEIPNIRSANGNTLCDGDSIELRTDSLASSFFWTLNGQIIAGQNANVLYCKASGNYQVWRVGTTCNRSSNVFPIIAAAKPATPTISSNLAGTSFCPGGTATLTSSANAGNQWYKNGVLVNGANNKTLSVQDSGVYTVRVNGNGCWSSFANPLTLGLRIKPTTSEITGKDSVNANANEVYSVNATTGSSYAWTIIGGSIVAGNNTATATIRWNNTASGRLTVQETASSGCKGDSKILNVSISPPVGIAPTSFIEGIQVYPNPTAVSSNIIFASPSADPVSIEVINLLGQSIWSNDLPKVGAGESVYLDLANLKPGMYIVQVQTKEAGKQIRLIKK